MSCVQEAVGSGGAPGGGAEAAQEQSAAAPAAAAAPEEAAWDPMRYLPSTLVDIDDGDAAEAAGGPLMPLDRRVRLNRHELHRHNLSQISSNVAPFLINFRAAAVRLLGTFVCRMPYPSGSPLCPEGAWSCARGGNVRWACAAQALEARALQILARRQEQARNSTGAGAGQQAAFHQRVGSGGPTRRPPLTAVGRTAAAVKRPVLSRGAQRR